MRKEFVNLLHKKMANDDRLVVYVADLGYGLFDKIRDDYPKRFHNVGADEQLLLGSAIGASYMEKIPLVYSISSFLIRVPYEYICNYLNGERANIKLIGGGRGKDYLNQGPTHWIENDFEVMDAFPNIACFWPDDVEEMKRQMEVMLYNNKPSYMNLRK